MLIKGFVGKNIESITKLVNDFLVNVGVIDVDVENHPYEYRFFIKYDKPNGKNVKIRYFSGDDYLTLVRKVEKFGETVKVIDVKMISYDRNDYEYWEDDCHTTEFLVIYEDNNKRAVVKKVPHVHSVEVFTGKNLASLEKEIRFFMSKVKATDVEMHCRDGIYTVMVTYDNEKGRRMDIKVFGGAYADIEPKINKFLPAVGAVGISAAGYGNYQSCLILYTEPDGRRTKVKYFCGSNADEVKESLKEFIKTVDLVSVRISDSSEGCVFLAVYEEK
ncbi:MAG: hypothetical protein IJ666_06790 [Ruminococcus sp.]|nr:hypothetical protein [Ruminococcus sp.]